MRMTERQLVMNDVRFRYKPDMEDVLRGIDLEINRGEFIALVGHNGSGKSTLAKMLVGMLTPNKGEYKLFTEEGQVVEEDDLREHIGMVFQEPNNQILENNVFNEIAYGLKQKGYGKQEIEEIVNNILADINLSHVKDRHPYLLSRGQRKRVALASIVVLEPDIIICDEPTAALDYRSATAVMEALEKIYRQGTTIIFITHDVKVVAEYAQRTILLNQGQVIVDTDVKSFFMEHGRTLDEHRFITPQITKLALKINENIGGNFGSILTIDDFVERFKALTQA